MDEIWYVFGYFYFSYRNGNSFLFSCDTNRYYNENIKKRFTNQTNKPSFVEIVETIKRDNY